MTKLRNLFTVLICTTLLVVCAGAQTTTQIVDTVLNTDGTPFNGTVVISWTGGTAGSSPAPYSTSVKIYNGALSVNLVPSVASASSAFYVATFNSRDGLTSWVETWQVGPSSSPLTLAQVRTNLPTTGSSSGTTAISIGQVTGLSSYLNALSTSLNTVTSSFSGFNTTLAGLGTSVSNLTATVNNIMNNSTPASSGTPGFIDNEIPQGTVDGTNALFSLSNFPNPSTSLMLFVNGVLQMSGSDYTLASNKITFSSGSKPHVGDTVQASYRLGTNSQFLFVDGATPTGTMNGVNLAFTLPSTPNPGPSLKLYKNGMLLMPNLDYTLSGAVITFSSTAVTPAVGDSVQGYYRITTP
ncbi:MAG: hypothetical protein ACJ746_27965 [Bryobacteraceae bacterium]